MNRTRMHRGMAMAAGVGLALLAGAAAATEMPVDPGAVIFKADKVLSVGKDGASVEFKAVTGDSYAIEFEQSTMPKACTWKVGATEFATTKSGKAWLKVRVPFEADAADMKVTFTLDGVDGDPCKPYKIKNLKVTKA